MGVSWFVPRFIPSQLWLGSHSSTRGRGSGRDPSRSHCGNVKPCCPRAACSHIAARAQAFGTQLARLCGIAAHQLWAKPHFKFVVVGGNLDDFVPEQMRQMPSVVLTHLPFEHCGAITFRNTVERCSQCEETAQTASYVLQCFSNRVCK